ncbi:CPK10 [Symbiodinium pilosum]|uniref:CPK10 protein n=1 Tax=Symbiodinium pilosum TaxID=2952 RepID=A0A812WZC7_SYMPI|nr:CPK10 [Symbiodinium pilosum]
MGYELHAEFSNDGETQHCQDGGVSWTRFVQGFARLAHPAICCGARQEKQDKLTDVVLSLEGEQNFKDLFRVGELIGHGTFGKVYSCSRLSGEEALCVKIVATSGRHAARASKLPAGERYDLLRQIASLRHPNIVKYHQFLQSGDFLYVVMSRCLGPDLADHLEATGHLKMQDVKELSRMMLSAVAAVHQHGLMHRDVKPENFRFKDLTTTTLQLLDFGAAKIADDVPKAHTVVGTLLYAAPEVFDGAYGRSCDLWSCGAVIFYLVSGHLPFQTSDVTMLRSMHRDPVLNGECLFRGEHWRQAPMGARSLVRGLLSVDVNRRLTADEACDHDWFLSFDEAIQANDDPLSPMNRCEGSRVKLADLKRTYFDWNLADSDNSGEDWGDSEPRR